MYSVLISMIGFLLAIGILITVHEFGHFIVARAFGIKVLRFSIGFGKPFFRWYDKYGTEYVLSYLPLGGYVALFGERNHDIKPTERPMAFSYKPVWVRILVLAAGPFFNLGFAVFAYWLMFMIGISSLAPIIGQVLPKSAAEMAGLQKNYEIVAIDNKPTLGWEAVTVALISELGSNRLIPIDVRKSPNEKVKTHYLDVTSMDRPTGDHDFLKELGLVPIDPIPPVVHQVLPGYPAANSDIQPLDRIIAVNGHPVSSRSEASQYIQPQINKSISLTYLRGSEKKEIRITPVAKEQEDGKAIGFLGIVYSTTEKPDKDLIRIHRYGVRTALSEAVKRTWNYTILTLEMLKKMIVGTISMKYLSGPVSIAKSAGISISIGIEHFLNFLAVVSISLGVINLLPIPMLDGGQIVYCLWELITHRRVSYVAQMIGFWIGGLIIISIMTIALYNDLTQF